MRQFVITISALLVFASSALANESMTLVAGTAPAIRPLNAPTVMMVSKDARWYQEALQGVSAPYPQSLRFLDDQGAWYTPFTRPGMTGHYDIRGWHH